MNNGVLDIAKRLAAAGCVQPFPDSKVVSERMQNLAALFEFIHNYAAEGCFKSMAKEVAEIEKLVHAAKAAVNYTGHGHPLVGRPEWEQWLCDYEKVFGRDGS